VVQYDKTNREILTILQDDARLTWAEVGRRVGLSAPAVAERVRRLEEAGVVRGYGADLDLDVISVPVVAFVRLSLATDRYAQVTALLNDEPGVLECHHITGPEAFICKLVVPSLGHLDEFLLRFHGVCETTTNVVLSTPVRPRRPPMPPSRDD
jgi:Lrp/AsnC family leucine-responsive transcriptional regulator